MHCNLRAGGPADAEVCAMICYEAFKTISGQHNFPPDFPSFEVARDLFSSLLSRPNVYSVIAESEGRIVGSNFLWENAVIAGVGPLTIAPDVQNSSLGRLLMENVLERARQKRTSGVRLVQAAYHTRSLALYAKLGFEVREPLANLQGPALRLGIPSLRSPGRSWQRHGCLRPSFPENPWPRSRSGIASRNERAPRAP